jgi:hypothetical protein
MNQQVRDFMTKARVLFVIDGCGHCAKWKEFIERLNLEVPIEKRIRVINCTNYNSLGIEDYQIIKLFDKYMEGNYPFLFFEKVKLNGANSREECEAFIRSALHKNFIIPRVNNLLFEKKCRYSKVNFLGKKTIICE